MPKSPILGGFSKARSSNLADNDLFNLFVEIIETKDGSEAGALFNAPGLDLLGTIGSGPIRGVRDLNDTLYVVSGSQVYSVTPNGISTLLGAIGYRTTPVSMFDNGLQLMIVDGVGAWLVPGGYPLTGGTISSGGGQYAVGDTIVLKAASGFQSSYPIIEITSVLNAPATQVSLTTGGTAYSTASGVSTSPASNQTVLGYGTGLTLNITASGGPIIVATIANGGHGYVPGNLGIVNSGSNDAKFIVNSVGPNGTVTGFKVIQGGAVSAQANTFTQKSTSGSGSGFVLTSPTYGSFVGLVPITVPFTHPVMGDVSDGFGLLIFQGSQNIAQSDELDLSTWQPLNYGVADQSPDKNMALKVIHNEAYVLKQRNTEVWVDQGQAGFSFAPLGGVHMEWGCHAPFSLTKAGDVLLWVSRNDQGQYLVVQAAGYQVTPVSTQALVAEFEKYSNVGDAIGYSFQQGGHTFYVLTLPEADKTWVYDLTSSALAGVPIWHRIASWSDGEWHRHWGNCFWPWKGFISQTNTLTEYQAQAVNLIGTYMVTPTGLNGLPASFSTAVFSVWVDIPDSTTSGLIFSNQSSDTSPGTNPGLFIQVYNDGIGSPEITIKAWDVNRTAIVSATYAFTNWSAGWVNLLVSIDTATQTLQVYANTNTSNVLVESKLSPSAITWTSSNPIASSSTQPWHVRVFAES